MYNWSVDEQKFKKEDPEGYKIWRIEQMINFGLGDEKIREDDLKKYLDKMDIDELTRKYLTFLLWPMKSKY